jgi:hypothetical protein
VLSPDPTGTLPALLDLHSQGDTLSAQLGALERWLREIAENTAPVVPRYPNSKSNALENSRVVNSGATQLYGFAGVNTNAAAQFILAFDRTGVPANGAIPDFVLKAPASDNFWCSWAPAWRNFSEGVVLCNSSTAATLTIGVADCWFDAQYTALPPA